MREKIIDMLCICFKFQDMECFLNSFFFTFSSIVADIEVAVTSDASKYSFEL